MSDAAFAGLEADRVYQGLPDREKNFLANFLSSVTGDAAADGMNFQADLRSYKFKSDKLYSVYTRHYPQFAKGAKSEDDVEPLKPSKMGEGDASKMGVLEKMLEGLLKQIDWDPAVTVKRVRDGLKASLENWAGNDPAHGHRGGKVGAVTFAPIKHDDLGMRWEWEPASSEEMRNAVEALFIKNKPEIREIFDSIEKFDG